MLLEVFFIKLFEVINKHVPNMLEQREIKHFIEKDFDALTDYGLLCKVVDYLNQVITNENTDRMPVIPANEIKKTAKATANMNSTFSL